MKVTSQICAKNCVFAIEENSSGYCRNPNARKIMGQAWAPLVGFDCQFYFTQEMANAAILSKRNPHLKMSPKHIRDILDGFGVPHRLDGENRVYKVHEIVSYLCDNGDAHTPQQSRDITSIYIQLVLNGLTEKDDEYIVPRPQWTPGRVEI